MPVFRILNQQLVGEAEFARKGDDLMRGLAAPTKLAAPSITLDDASIFPFHQPVASVGGEALTPLPPVGFGLPLTIEIRHAYSGRVGAKAVLGPTGDIAVVSGVKNWGVFKASARALNWVDAHKGKRSRIDMPNALQDGTAVVAYSPAVATEQMLVTFELAAATTGGGLAATLGKAFTAAGGVPLMLPYQGALLAGGAVLQVADKLLQRITGGSNDWSADAELNFGKPGTVSTVADFRLVAQDGRAFEGFRYKHGQGLVDAQGRDYAGDEPYVVIAIFGGAQSGLAEFAPTVAGAELLKRFHLGDSGVGLGDDLIELLATVSDVKYRREADALAGQIASATGDAQAALKAKRDAIVKNIRDGTLRPS